MGIFRRVLTCVGCKLIPGRIFRGLKQGEVNLVKLYIPVPGSRRPGMFSRNRGTVNPPITHKKKQKNNPVAVFSEHRRMFTK